MDTAKALLASVTVVQTASALIRNGIPYVSTMPRGLEARIRETGSKSRNESRGKLSYSQALALFDFERAQYVGLLLSQM